jgi:putative ABC transport system ATP-binding protein
MAAGQPLVVCEDLKRSYGDYAALKGVSFSIARGEFAAVMGPSGCGKSTLLALLGLLDRPSGGRYLLDGVDARGMTDAELTRLRRERIGFVFQAYNLLPRLSALENVALPMAYAGLELEERRARALKLLTRVGLAEKAGRTPLELSGGERQRVGIARSLSNNPSLLLADEPTGNLDSKSSVDVLAFFKELHAEGLTILLVTHDAAVGAAAQRILRLKDGMLA